MNEKEPQKTGVEADPPRKCRSDVGNGELVELGEQYTPQEERDVLRKIDFTILPMVRPHVTCSGDSF